jgi:uncharacterized circularly permuted ATP-grasp superfamily protein
MLSRAQYWLATSLAVVCLLLLAGQAGLAHQNRQLRVQVDTRQQFVQQSAQLQTLYSEIVRALAELGARNNDQQVRALLQQHGITYTVNDKKAAP